MRSLRRRQGFTLIEVLIAMAIFAIGSLGVLAMMTTALQENANGRQAGEATLLATWKLEQMEGEPLSASDYSSCTTRCWEDASLVTQTATRTLRAENVNGSALGSSVYYQLTWQTGNANNVAGGDWYVVSVMWPRDKRHWAEDYSATNYVNCVSTPGQCHRVDFYGMHR